MIAALAKAGGDSARLRFRARPDPAGEPRPAARRHRLSRARELPARPHTTVAERIERSEAARDRARRRRGAGDRLRLHRAAAGKPRAAGRHRRRRQSEKLDRPARRVHPRDRRPRARLRPHRGRLSRPALCGDSPEDISGAGARRLAALADPLPPRPRGARCRPRSRRCTRASGWSIHDDADFDDGISVERRSRRRRRRTRSSAIAPSATPA